MNRIPEPREVINREALSARLDAIAEERDPKSAAGRAMALELVREALETGRAEIRRHFEAGTRGTETARAQTFLIDQLVRTLYDHVWWHVYRATNPTAGERLGIVAVGGYGRREMAPFSDVDLLFLHPYKLTAWAEQTIEYILYMLWDLGLTVGQATRSIDECVRLGRRDYSIRTALLESRYVWGDRDLYDELRRRFISEIAEGTGLDFVEAKLAERDARHQRLGDSRYLLEPNIKESKGGLRDLHTLFWIGKYLYGVEEIADLVAKGVLTRAELNRFQRTESFLWNVRCHLHYRAGRAEERLTFDAQIDLAAHLGYRENARTRAVERFMKHYYLVAKDVGDLTRIFCAALEDQHRRKPRLSLARFGLFQRDLEGFADEGGRLNVTDDETFARDPVAMLRLFRVAQVAERDIHPHALKLITRNLKHLDDGVRTDPEANRLFMEMLTSRTDPATALKRMNEAGVFGRFVPDFGRVVAQTQHDMYHVYTVDEHTIRAIGVLSEIERGLHPNDHPLSTGVIQMVLSRRVLYHAVLLHDIAKGRGGNHSELGAEVALELGPRLGLEDEEVETVSWLVRYHLAMSHIAFKRDLYDPKTISDFVELVQSPERLRLLVALTVADIRAVGPGRWNNWKGELLRELFYLTEEAMSGGHAASRRKERLAEARDSLVARLTDWPVAGIDAHFARCPESYWLSTDHGTQARHTEMISAADCADRPLSVDAYADYARGVTEVTVYVQDHPGLFARLAGAIVATGGNIVDAKIHTTTDGMALDTFTIQDRGKQPFESAARLKRMIDDSLNAAIDLDRTLAERGSGLPPRASVFTVRPRVLIDNKASNLHTVIEVNGRDRAGLLYAVTKVISQLGLSIASAHITTYGERAVDVFYVKDVFGLKVTQSSKLDRVRKDLMQVLKADAGPPTIRAADTTDAAE